MLSKIYMLARCAQYIYGTDQSSSIIALRGTSCPLIQFDVHSNSDLRRGYQQDIHQASVVIYL